MRSFRTARMQSCLFVGLIVGLGACAGTTSQLSSGSVEGAVGTVSKPDTLERLDEITDSPEFQDSLARTTAAMARGISNGIDIDHDHLNQTTEEIGWALGRGLARGLVDGLGELPSARRLVDDA